MKTILFAMTMMVSATAFGVGGPPCGTQEQCDKGLGYGLYGCQTFEVNGEWIAICRVKVKPD